MMIKNWLYISVTTVLYGSAVTLLLLGSVKLIFPGFVFMDEAAKGTSEIGYALFGSVTVSIVCVVGFFAYLVANYYMIGILKNRFKAWNGIQIFFIFLTLADLVFLRYENFARSEESIWRYAGLPIVIVTAAIAVAWWKVKLTNKNVWIPTLFFMIVVTSLELIPAMQANEDEYLLILLGTLVVLNARLILILHKLVNRTRAAKAAAAKTRSGQG